MTENPQNLLSKTVILLEEVFAAAHAATLLLPSSLSSAD